VSADQERTDRLDRDIDADHGEARADHALGSLLGLRGVLSGLGEAPNHDQPRDRLDQAVGTEADQGEGGRGKPGGDCDGSLGDVPADSKPGQQPGAMDKLPVALG
jgi:hypothetical protein